MKRLFVAMLVFPALVAAVVIGCDQAQQGNGVMCTTIGDGGIGSGLDGGVCFFPPTAAAARTQCGQVTEFCDTTGVAEPALGCLGKSGPAPGAAPATVTLTGFVQVFSSGPDSNNVRVQVFDAAAVTATDPGAQQPIVQVVATLDPATQRACDKDATKGCSIPLANGCAQVVCNAGLVDGGVDDQKYCRDNGAGGECSDRLRWESRYSLAGVPTNTRLVVRVTGPGNKSDSLWATTVAFNVFLSTNDPACKSLSDTECLNTSDPAHPTYQLNVNALSATDYVSLSVASGLPGGTSSGQGAILGEVRDCDNVRLANVEVATDPRADRFTYFNGNPVDTRPDATRAAFGTDQLGLFAAFNVQPGPVQVDAAGGMSAGAELESFGTFDVFVYENTLSIVTINGGKGTR